MPFVQFKSETCNFWLVLLKRSKMSFHVAVKMACSSFTNFLNKCFVSRLYLGFVPSLRIYILEPLKHRSPNISRSEQLDNGQTISCCHVCVKNIPATRRNPKEHKQLLLNKEVVNNFRYCRGSLSPTRLRGQLITAHILRTCLCL